MPLELVSKAQLVLLARPEQTEQLEVKAQQEPMVRQGVLASRARSALPELDYKALLEMLV